VQGQSCPLGENHLLKRLNIKQKITLYLMQNLATNFFYYEREIFMLRNKCTYRAYSTHIFLHRIYFIFFITASLKKLNFTETSPRNFKFSIFAQENISHKEISLEILQGHCHKKTSKIFFIHFYVHECAPGS
jgi:hypothetical protein